MGTSLLATSVWIPGLLVIGVVLIVAVVVVALRTMRNR